MRRLLLLIGENKTTTDLFFGSYESILCSLTATTLKPLTRELNNIDYLVCKRYDMIGNIDQLTGSNQSLRAIYNQMSNLAIIVTTLVVIHNIVMTQSLNSSLWGKTRLVSQMKFQRCTMRWLLWMTANVSIIRRTSRDPALFIYIIQPHQTQRDPQPISHRASGVSCP